MSSKLTVEEAMKKAGGSKAKAAKLLGIPRTTLISRLESAGRTRVDRTPPAESIFARSATKTRIKDLERLVKAETKRANDNAALYAAVAEVRAVVKTTLTHTGPKVRRKPHIGAKHLVIPDTQVSADVPTNHLVAAGEYAAEKQPDTIVVIGDWWDMPSLSSYDRGKLQFEGRRYRIDIEAGRVAMEAFLAPIRRAKNYKPRIVFTTGNHENRVVRAAQENSWLDGTIGPQDFGLEAMGLEVYPFLQPVTIDGVKYAHFFPRAASGKVMQIKHGAPNAKAQLVREGGSCVAGHQQGLDVACLPLRDKLQWGIIAGSFYSHEEEYLGPQGTAYWRGVIMLHQVRDGGFSPMVVDLEYLLAKYS